VTFQKLAELWQPSLFPCDNIWFNSGTNVNMLPLNGQCKLQKAVISASFKSLIIKTVAVHLLSFRRTNAFN